MISRIKRHLWPVLGEPIPIRPMVRGGPPQPTIEPEVPPLELSGRDYAIFLLRLAAEIEHGLMVQYLFAAYSLGGPQVPAAQQPQLLRWQETLLGVAKEEMGHLVTVQNVLTALGGPLQFNREDYPHDNVLYETGFRLQALDLSSLATYICAESPDGWDTPEARAIKHQANVQTGADVNRVGRLYAELIRVIADPALVSDSTFNAASQAFQASWDAWGRGFRQGLPGTQGGDDHDQRDEHELVIVTVADRASALDALQRVSEQGEGFDSPEEDASHFERFLEIHRGLSALDETARSALVRKLAPNPTTHLDGDDVAPPGERTPTSTTAISNPQARLWAHLFNVRYRKLLVSLSHTFELAGERAAPGPGGPRGALINRAFGEMYNMRSIAGALVVLPIDHANPAGERAGPPFQMPYTLMLAQHEADRWRLHRDLLDASALLIERIGATGGAPRAYLTALAQADEIERGQLDLLIAAATPAPEPPPP